MIFFFIKLFLKSWVGTNGLGLSAKDLVVKSESIERWNNSFQQQDKYGGKRGTSLKCDTGVGRVPLQYKMNDL